MRITFVVGDADLSGGLRVIATYAQRLHQRGHEVKAISRPRKALSFKDKLKLKLKGQPVPPDPQKAPTHLDWMGVPHRRINTYRPITAADLPDADVVIATWWETAEWVESLPASKGVKVHFIQDYEIWLGEHTISRVDATCRMPMPKITPARWVKEMMENMFGQTDVTLVPNAVDLDTFKAEPRGKQARPTVGFMYTPFLNKGSDVSIKAIELARKQIPDLQIKTFGNVAPNESLPLPEGAEFHYRASEAKVVETYGSCDVWLFGTRKEGFGLPILEAMACRTPVIGTPAGAAPDLLSQGGGTLVPMEDHEAMADAMVKILKMNDADWRQLSDKAHATANRYTWEDATNDFEAVLQRVFRQTPNHTNGPAAPTLMRHSA